MYLTSCNCIVIRINGKLSRKLESIAIISNWMNDFYVQTLDSCCLKKTFHSFLTFTPFRLLFSSLNHERIQIVGFESLPLFWVHWWHQVIYIVSLFQICKKICSNMRWLKIARLRSVRVGTNLKISSFF